MESKFREFMSNEAERLDRDVKHAEEKSAADAEARAARRRELWRAICNSRSQQLANRKAQRHAALEADKAFAAAWKARSILSAVSYKYMLEMASLEPQWIYTDGRRILNSAGFWTSRGFRIP